MHHLWFRVLDTRALRYARAVAQKGPIRIIADAVTPKAAANLSRRPLPIDVSVLPACMAVEDEHGCNVRARGEVIGATLLRRAAGSGHDYRWLGPELRPWRSEWLRICGSQYYAAGEPIIFFLTFVENAYRTGVVEKPDSLLIDLGQHSVAEEFAAHAAEVLKLPFPIQVLGRSPNPLLLAGRVLARQAAQTVYYMLKRMLRRKLSAKQCIPVSERGIVLVGYERGMLDRLPLGVTVDWIECSRIAPERIVFCFNRADSPLSEETIRRLHERGFGWVDFQSVPALDDASWWTLFRTLANSLRTMPLPWDRSSLRRWTVIAALLPIVNWYRAFIRTHRVLAFHQGMQFTPNSMALNLACRQEGAAVVWSFWSVLLLMEYAANHAFADLLMTFGDYDLAYCNAISFDYRYAAQIGVAAYDGTESDDAESASRLRARLTANPRFILAIFDSGHGSHPLHHHSTSRCLLFYRTILDLLRRHTDWGCLIKSKADAYDQLPIEPGLQDIVSMLEADGRCLRLPNETKPSLVALAANVVVGFGINTAAITASLITRRPCIHFDPNHLFMHPLSVAGADGKIIFRDAEGFCAAVTSIAEGNATFGDLTPWAKLFDPFRDGFGRKRSGEIMREYVSARDRGANLEDALNKAVSVYAQHYGSALVATRIGLKDTPASQLWRKVRAQHYADWPEEFPYALSRWSHLSKPAEGTS